MENILMSRCSRLCVIVLALSFLFSTSAGGEKVIPQRAGECVTCDENSRWMEKVRDMEKKVHQLEKRYSRMDDSLTDLEDLEELINRDR